MVDIAKLRRAIADKKAHWKQNLGHIPRPTKEEDGTVTIALLELVVDELKNLSKEVDDLRKYPPGSVRPL